METDVPAGDDPDGSRDDELSTESILEALLVEDAEIAWDPLTGKPLVVRRPKITLDRSPDSA
jgi:hypothetical protein